MPIKKPWPMKHKHVILVGDISLFAGCILGMFILILVSPSNLSPFLAALSLTCLFVAIPLRILYLSVTRLDKILAELEHEVMDVKISGFLIYSLSCEGPKYGKFSLKYWPHIRSVTGEESFWLPERGHYKLWISTAKSPPKLAKIFTKKNGLLVDSQNKFLAEKLIAIKLLTSIRIEQIGDENRIVARFGDKWNHAKTSDITECLKILREIEDKYL
jgi:hypothetical protein